MLDEKTRELQEEAATSGGADNEKVMGEIKNDFGDNKEEVIQMLIENIMNVNIEIPKVVKGKFEED